MKESDSLAAGGMKLNPVVVSKPGAAIRVEKSELSPRLRKGLTTNLKSLTAPPRGQR
jgi:hypothetical protein